MFGNCLFATTEFGSDKILNIGYDINNVVEEVLIFEPGDSVNGDTGSAY